MGAASSNFCHGASTMSHYGFNVPGVLNTALEWSCVVFLFNSVQGERVVPVVLDNPVKYAFAVLGVVLMGVLVESLVAARRRVARAKLGGWRGTLALSGVYGVQVTLAYFLMLLSMTYSVPIFFAIVTGLAVGHVAFNYDPHDPVKEERCC